MANIKKINGYDIIDSKMLRATATINNLVKTTKGSTTVNYIDILLPSEWNANDSFVIGGYYKIINPVNSQILSIRPIYTSIFTPEGDDASVSEVSIWDDNGATKASCSYDVYVDWLEGMNCEYTILLYNKD